MVLDASSRPALMELFFALLPKGLERDGMPVTA